MGPANRPLSPHLDVYRWQFTNTLSILHRLTGVVLAAGALVLTAWLVALAAGPDAYLRVVGILGSPPGVLLLFGWTLCFFYHLCNGIRHLCWDAGRGFDVATARSSARVVIVAAGLLTVLFWVLVLMGGGA
jgi:succinate dehydrogenase / fumarate reductase cytochrome b subunit